MKRGTMFLNISLQFYPKSLLAFALFILLHFVRAGVRKPQQWKKCPPIILPSLQSIFHYYNPLHSCISLNFYTQSLTMACFFPTCFLILALVLGIRGDNSLSSVRINDLGGKLIYPITQSSHSSTCECALPYSVYVRERQIYVVEADFPFSVIVHTEFEDMKISGAASGARDKDGKYRGDMIVLRRCANIFGEGRFTTMFEFYLPKSKSLGSYAKGPVEQGIELQEFEAVRISIPTHTYCVSSRELSSLQSFFDYGYTMICSMIISMVPTFPAESGATKSVCMLILLLCVLASYSGPYLSVLPFLMCLFLLLKILIRKYGLFVGSPILISERFEMSTEHEKLYQLSNNSDTSLLTSLLIISILMLISKPSISKDSSQAVTVNLVYVACIFLYNIAANILIVKIFCSLLWFNRLRTVFYWFIFAYFYARYSEYLAQLLDEYGLWGQKSGLIRLLLPIVYSQGCRYRSMFFFMLMMPVGQFMDKFMEVKASGMLMMTVIMLLEPYSIYWTYWAFTFVAIMWLVIMMARDGYYKTLTQVWVLEKPSEQE